MTASRGIIVATLIGLGGASLGWAQPPAFSRTDVFIGGQNGYHTYRIPVLAITKDGTLLAFCEGRKNDASDYGNLDLLLKRSRDGGRTWSGQTIVHEEGGDAEITIGNPCPIVDKSGVVHLLFTRNNARMFYTRSTDNGETWAKPKEYTEILKGLNYPLVRIATGPVHGIQTRAGRLVVPIWVCDRTHEGRNDAVTNSRYQSGVIYCDDDGVTWKTGRLVQPEVSQLNECSVIERKDGSLLLNMRALGAGFRAVSESTDGGETWSVPVLDKNLICPTCQASIQRLSDDEIIFTNPASKKRNNLTIRLSRDEGKTWPVSRVIDKGHSGYSDLAVTKDGKILCLYECGEKTYNQKIVIARFDRAWILDGK